MSNNKMNKLQIIFQKNGFQIDEASQQLDERQEKLKQAFLEDKYMALYRLGLDEKLSNPSPSFHFLEHLSDVFFEALTSHTELELVRDMVDVKIDDERYEQILNTIPFMLGSEFIDKKWINNVFKQLTNIFQQEIVTYKGTVSMYLTEQSQQLRVPERVFFHLVENKEDEEYPFAFLATYATKAKNGKVIHVPLEYALTEYQNDRAKLLQLLGCLNKAGEVSPLIAQFVESGEMFHPLRLSAQEAYVFLKDLEAIEKTGILCRVPNWWKKKVSSVFLNMSLKNEQSFLGAETLLTLQPELVVDGVALTKDDILQLLSQSNGLAFIKGKWVEVDKVRLSKLLEKLDEEPEAITLFDALRSGVVADEDDEDDENLIDPDGGSIVSNTTWLNQLLHKLRTPLKERKLKQPKTFQATLRPYQQEGYSWLNHMSKIGFGACLADDMGLGKTIQVLAFLEKLRANKEAKVLLVVPASLLGNWQKEASKFAPNMPLRILHGRPSKVLDEELKSKSTFLTITTYGMAIRLQRLQEITWDCLILDEAQAIKNPLTKQTREIKKLNAHIRIAMSGTPIENDLTNLWSLFDFLNKGLLGSANEFKDFCRQLDQDATGYARLKAIVAPFMLRRLKTDKSIISDLPEKVELIDYIDLSKKQVVLYRKLVSELAVKLDSLTGMERRGIVLAYLSKFKQICNHPDQYLGQQGYIASESGKFERLRQLCETIYEKRERVIIFTQFKEIIEYLDEFLASIFHRKGYVLHGGTPVSKRNEIVEAFQGERYVPYIILSLKAGGTGLNLTNANHVIHFDRWWNPAVENQATDRAYRIGQKKTVMVHKLVSSGTIEEKIDEMINSKKELAENVIGSGGEKWITDMSNEELLSVLKLEK